MTQSPRPRGRRTASLLVTLAALAAAATTGTPTLAQPLAAHAATAYAAPLPTVIEATYFDKGRGEYVFRDRATDLKRMHRVFNTVVVSASPWRYGSTALVRAVRRAGMSAVLELDYKDEFIDGENISTKVNQVIATTKDHPGLIAGIHVADQLNKGTLTPDEQVAYLDATAGRFHKALPGVPVFVDAASWELTCDEQGQASCAGQRDSEWKYQTNAVLRRLARTGDIDGFFLSDNLLHNNAAVQKLAMERARELFPAPFRIVSRTSHLSFPERQFPGTDARARRLVRAYVLASIRGGADGAALWSWHRPWTNENGVDEVRTFLDKDFTGNALWAELVAHRPPA